MSGTPSLSLVLADDHPIVLRGMRDLLAEVTTLDIVATCSNGREALEAIEAARPDIAVLDVRMPEFSGLDILARIREERYGTRVVLLTASITDGELLDAIAMGLDGLVLKDTLPDQLVRCVREVAAGRRFLPNELIARARIRERERSEAGAQLFGSLTARERLIAASVADGLSNKAIAERFVVSEGTVKVHLHNIFQKLGVTNRAALAAIAVVHADYLSLSVRSGKGNCS